MDQADGWPARLDALERRGCLGERRARWWQGGVLCPARPGAVSAWSRGRFRCPMTPAWLLESTEEPYMTRSWRNILGITAPRSLAAVSLVLMLLAGGCASDGTSPSRPSQSPTSPSPTPGGGGGGTGGGGTGGGGGGAGGGGGGSGG